MILGIEKMLSSRKMKLLIIVLISILILDAALFFLNYLNTASTKGINGSTPQVLSKKEMIEIARNALKNRLPYDVKRIRYDTGNKWWNRYDADRHPELLGRDYQVIYFSSQSGWNIQIGGGGYVCVDIKTGEVLQFSIYM
jgi:hypothetical protein